MASKTIRVEIIEKQGMCTIPISFDPRQTFGKARPPVKVTLNGYTYRSTIFSMRGETFIPLRRSHREAAGVAGGQTVEVAIALDEEKREVKAPADLVKALKAVPPAWDRWKELSFTHQREYVEAIEEAKKPETRARRIENAVREVGARTAKQRAVTVAGKRRDRR